MSDIQKVLEKLNELDRRLSNIEKVINEVAEEDERTEIIAEIERRMGIPLPSIMVEKYDIKMILDFLKEIGYDRAAAAQPRVSAIKQYVMKHPILAAIFAAGSGAIFAFVLTHLLGGG